MMNQAKMHPDEYDITPRLVRHLIARQFPAWAHMPLIPVEHQGSCNVMYKLGDDKVIRLPRNKTFSDTLEREFSYLQDITSHLPLTIPHPLEHGKPDKEYPFSWAIYHWIQGTTLSHASLIDYDQAARDIGIFVSTLRKTSRTKRAQSQRDTTLQSRDERTRNAIPLLNDLFDSNLLMKLWDDALEVPPWTGEHTWIHGDLHPGNVLVNNGELNAVIDFAFAGIGDPAIDLMIAWNFLTPTTRKIFYEYAETDSTTWNRGRGWALTFGIMTYRYFRTINSTLATISKKMIHEVILDHMQQDSSLCSGML